MTTPPIVGVPALAWCVDGPSSRMSWPNERSRRNRIHSGVTRRATRKPTDPDSMRLSIASPQQLSHDLAVVEFHHPILEGLGRLVPLARHDDHVPALGLRQGGADRRAAIHLATHHGARYGPGHDGVDDHVGVLAAGIVRGDDRPVRARGGDGPHVGTLLAIALTAT